MIDTIVWDPIVPLVPLILTGALVLAILIVIEWRRKQRFKWIRIGCQVIAVFSVVGVLLRPAIGAYKRDQPVLILTAGFPVQQVDSLRRVQPALLIYRTPGAEEFPGAAVVKDFRALKSLRGDPMWLAGEGVPEYVLRDIDLDFQYLPAIIPDGIVELTAPSSPTVERWNKVDIIYHASTGGRRKLILSGPGGAEDSANITTAGNSQVSLSMYPKVAGKIVYKLIEKDSSGAIVASNSLPFSVKQEDKLEILLVTDHPTFEQRYLKNFLVAKAHRVSVRNRVSKDRYHQEFANRPRQSLDKLTPSMLNKTDLLIIDQTTFQTLAANEKRSIRSSMETGLGVLLLAGEKSSTDQLLAFQSIMGRTDTVRFSLGKQGMFTLPAAQIKPPGEVTPYLVSNDGRVLTGCQCTGITKTGFQLLRETYQLGLQGDSSAYSAVWTPLLEQTARKNISNLNIIPRTLFPLYSNEPFEFDILSDGASASAAFDGIPVPLAEDTNLDDVWHGKLYAEGNKWHTLTAGSDSNTFEFMDLPHEEWNSLRTARQIRVNSLHEPGGIAERPGVLASQRSFPLIFFLLFALSSGFLWLAPKI